MGLLEASVWGLCGGLCAGLVSLAAVIKASGFRWPWRDSEGGLWPHLVVGGIGILVGGVVSAAAHTQITGAWPALIMGATAPAVIRGVLSRVEVSEEKAVEEMPREQA